MKRSFEDFLKDRHMADYHGTDDDSVDAFEKWICELDAEETMNFADTYGKEMFLRGMDHAIKKFKETT